jgi:parallel beta-helix repeat protein
MIKINKILRLRRKVFKNKSLILIFILILFFVSLIFRPNGITLAGTPTPFPPSLSVSPSTQAGGSNVTFSFICSNIYNVKGYVCNQNNCTGSTYRMPITISYTGSTLINYQVNVRVSTASLISAGKMRANCGDIRFTDSDEKTMLSYWIENGTYDCNSDYTLIWVRVPSIPNGGKTIYMHYGNPSATSEANGNATFLVFDDFSTADASKFSYGSAYGGNDSILYAIENGALKVWSDSSWRILRMNNTNFLPNQGVAIKIRFQTAAASSSYTHTLVQLDNVTQNRFGIIDTASLNYVAMNKTGEGESYPYTFGTISANTWYKAELLKLNVTDLRSKMYYDNDTQFGSTYERNDADWNYGGVGTTWTWVTWQYENVNVSYDWFFVRNYSDPEPSTSLGTEQNIGGGFYCVSPESTSNPSCTYTLPYCCAGINAGANTFYGRCQSMEPYYKPYTDVISAQTFACLKENGCACNSSAQCNSTSCQENVCGGRCQVYINSLPYNITQSNTYYCLNTSITDLGVTAIQFGNSSSWIVQNSTLYCRGNNIDGNDIGNTYGVYLIGSDTKNNTIKNCNITDFRNGIYLDSGPSNNILINNTVNSNSNGIYIYSSSNNNILINNTVNSNSNGIYIYSSSNNTVTGGSVAFSSTSDYNLSSVSTTNNFTSTNFTDARKIRFNDVTSWFNYNNYTSGNIWLKTSVPSSTTITRKLINWNQNLIQWNDSASGITATYNITGLKANTTYSVSNNSAYVQALQTDSSGTLPSFTIFLNSEHEIKVQAIYLIVNLSTPSPLVCNEIYPCDWDQYGVYWVNATVKCINTYCGNVTGLVRYNSSGNIMIPISTTQGDEPFYIVGGGGNPVMNWSKVDTSGTSPGNITQLNMVYDSDADRVIMFGGTRTGSGAINETWLFNRSDNKWYNVTKSGSPSNRTQSPAMAYDPVNKRTILFGGFNGSTARATDTWVFNYTDLKWYKMSPSGTPTGRSYSAMVYVSSRKVIVLFGGTSTGTNRLADTWAYNYSTNTWYNITNNTNPNCVPRSREEHFMAYDSNNDRIIMYGGYSASPSANYINETWEFNYTDLCWYNISKTAYLPQGRDNHKMVYDSESQRVILFGGLDNSDYRDDTWEFNYTDKKWYQMNMINRPPKRELMGLTYDDKTDDIIMFGGDASLRYNDTWILDYSSGGSGGGNPISLGTLNDGMSASVNFKVNATGDTDTRWKIDVNFSSDLNVWNNTDNAVIRIFERFETNVTSVTFNVSSFQYNNPIKCNGTIMSKNVSAVYYKIYHAGNEINPEYTGSLNLINDCVGSSWDTGKTCNAVVPNVQGFKGNWNCSIIAYNGTANTTGYVSTPAVMVNTPPSIPNITGPVNGTMYNKKTRYIFVICHNTTSPADVNPEDTVSYIMSYSPYATGAPWTNICAGDLDGNCTFDLQNIYPNYNRSYIRCNMSDGTTTGPNSDLIYIRIDWDDPVCNLTIPNSQILVSPYILNGTFNDSNSGIANVTYYNLTNNANDIIGTNYTANYTYKWDVPSSLENNINVTLMAVCYDNAGNSANDTETGIVVDMINSPPQIWNLRVRNLTDYPIDTVWPRNLVLITVNASDSDPVRNISYVECNFTDVNKSEIKIFNLTEAKPGHDYTHNESLFIKYYWGPGQGWVNVTVYDRDRNYSKATTNITILEGYELALYNNPINFSISIPGTEKNATDKQGWPMIIQNYGNIPVNVSQNASYYLTGLSNPNVRILINNITWNQTDTGNFSELTNFDKIINATLQPGKNQSIYYKMKIPALYPQDYGGLVTYHGSTT